MNDISKDKDYQEFFAGIKELAKGLMQIRERAAIEYAPIVEELCARRHATANEVGRMLDYLFEFADDERILLMYKKVCRRFVYDYPETISYYIMEYRKEFEYDTMGGIVLIQGALYCTAARESAPFNCFHKDVFCIIRFFS